MPDAEPYRAWQTFTFTAQDGHIREVDLFIVTPGGLFLVEIKSHRPAVNASSSDAVPAAAVVFREPALTRG